MRQLLAVAVLGLCVSGAFSGDDPAKGRLPKYWNKLGLSKDQVTKVYGIQSDAKKQIDDLETKVKVIKEKEQKDMMAVLTDEQKKVLKKIVDDKSGVGDTDDKKPTDDKK